MAPVDAQEPRRATNGAPVGHSPYSTPAGPQEPRRGWVTPDHVGESGEPGEPPLYASDIPPEILARVALTLLKDGEADLGVKFLEAAVERMPLARYPERWLFGG